MMRLMLLSASRITFQGWMTSETISMISWILTDGGRLQRSRRLSKECLILPSSIYSLNRLIKLTKVLSMPYYGQFQHQTPLYKEDMALLSPQFCVFKLLLKESNKNFINSYKERCFYFTYSEIVILSQGEQSYTVDRMFLLEDIVSIQGCEDKGFYKLTLKLKQGKTYKIKWNMNAIDDKQMKRLLIFQFYYRSAIEELQPPKEYSQRLQSINLYNQVIISAFELQKQYIADWAKKKIVDLA